MQAELDACKKIDAARPDAYFNEGILTQEYKAKGAGGTDKAIAVYQQAKQMFQSFMDKASGKTGVRRRRQEGQGADAGHRRHHHLPPGRWPASERRPPPPPAPPGAERQQRRAGRQRKRRRAGGVRSTATPPPPAGRDKP